MNAGVVSGLWRYPVKSMLGEDCRDLALDERGVEADRLYAVRDDAGRLGSGKNTRRLRQLDGLFSLRARRAGDFPEIAFPDGRCIRADDPGVHAALSEALGAPVALAREAGTVHFDSAAVHLVSTSALAWLRAQLPGSRIDERRFRPNIVIETPGAGQAEQAWIGRTLRIGAGVRLKVTETTERCRMTTLAQSGLPADPQVLRCLGREADLQFGVYAEVASPGRIALGDAVVLE